MSGEINKEDPFSSIIGLLKIILENAKTKMLF